MGGQAWPSGKAFGEISGLGVEGGGNFGAVTEVKHPDRAGRQVGRSAGRQVGSEYQPCPERPSAMLGTGSPGR